MRSILAKFVDSVSILLVGFILVFAWVRFYSGDITLSVIVALFASVILCVSIHYFSTKNERKKINSQKEKRAAQSLATSLLGATKTELVDYFERIFSQNAKIIAKGPNYLVFEPILAQDSQYYAMHSTMHSTFIFPCFCKIKIELDDLLEAIQLARSAHQKNIEIFGIEFSPEVKTFAQKIKNLNITFFDQYDLYKIAKNIRAPITIDTRVTTMNYSDYIRFAFDAKRAKNYLLFGLILLGTSFLVPYKIYYLITGSLLCFTALAVRIAPLIIQKRRR